MMIYNEVICDGLHAKMVLFVYHTFIFALPKLQRKHSSVHFVKLYEFVTKLIELAYMHKYYAQCKLLNGSLNSFP